ncbi:hypothetical protein THRCLA_09803 [Thraustotheca clavata]|uniref:Uncharacterized protein n=1 Tax=Thraustotheca clavata TaxID=74557 RepID=A0A1V9YU84_9STRA|nr:hypothetical protein THRCLA_09803 [Thraustotheca clavata]
MNNLILSNPQAQSEYYSLPAKPRVCEVPPFLLSDPTIMSNGGDLLCGDDVPFEPATLGLLSGFGPTNVCYALFLELFRPGPFELLFALLQFSYITPKIIDSDLEALCNLDKCAGSSCTTSFNTTLSFIQSYTSSFNILRGISANATQAARVLEINSIQYYTTLNDTATTSLYSINLLEPSEPHWNFYGWALLYEWAAGHREVVKFLGDYGSITSISYGNQPITTSAAKSDIPVSFASIFLGCTMYITWVLICIAGLVAIYGVFHKGHIEATNLFELNRIVGHVWAGRSILLLRSIVAIWILNTVQLSLAIESKATFLTAPELPWYQTILAASEVTWLVYVLNDVFSVFTEQYTTYYAYKSSTLTWFIVALWSFFTPRHFSIELDRECSYIDMDYYLICNSASIQIGSTTGVIIVVIVAFSCVIGCYILERIFFGSRPHLHLETLLLDSQCLYLLDLDKWKFEKEYFLDKTSAVMAGLLSFQYHKSLYILDIKSWRCIILPASSPHDPKLSSIPLSRI